jgi:hypothetical protein
MKKLLLISALTASTTLFAAAPNIPASEQIASFSVEEVTHAQYEAFTGSTTTGGSGGGQPRPDTSGPQFPPQYPQFPPPYPAQPSTTGDKIETAGKVIQTARDLVALGESVYNLVKQGRPTNVTEYAPISVIPRDPMTKEYADPFDLEGFSMPVEKPFIAKVKNGAGKEVVTFAYKVIYSYGGSYNGSGKYLTNVLIVPNSVKTSFGWDFNATMKLSGIMNHGSRTNPVAGVMVTIKYQMNSWSSAFERNDTIHITGKGEFKNYSAQ